MDDSDNELSDALSSDDEINNWVPDLLLAAIYSQPRPRILSNRIYTSQEYVDNLLKCGNDVRIKNQLCMKLNTFNLLRDWLVQNAGLKASRYTTVEEKLLIFIYISSKGMSNRAAQEQFNCGAYTISS